MSPPTILFTSAGEQAANVLRRALMDQVLRLPLAYFRGHRTGDTVTHFTADSAAIAEAYENAYGNGLAAAISVLGIVIVVAIIDWRFGVVAAVLVPLYMLLPRLRQGHHVRAAQSVQSATGELGGLATELIAGMRDIRAFNRQAWSLERLRRLLLALRDARVYQGFIVGWTWVTTTIFWIVYAGIFLVLAEPIFGGEVTIGFALALAGYLSWLNREVTPLTMAYVDLLHAVGAARRLFGFLDTPAEDDAGDGTSLAVTRGDIEFRSVNAAYLADTPVLQDVSFRVPGGSTTAIVGPSGAGKSTVVNLLLRFLQPSAGEIRLDGQTIGAASATEVRRHVGVVFQDPVLFHGSIADNIGFGRADIGQREVARAADIAAATDFVQATRDGFETQVGERALRLSGGQAQRIAIRARHRRRSARAGARRSHVRARRRIGAPGVAGSGTRPRGTDHDSRRPPAGHGASGGSSRRARRGVACWTLDATGSSMSGAPSTATCATGRCSRPRRRGTDDPPPGLRAVTASATGVAAPPGDLRPRDRCCGCGAICAVGASTTPGPRP